MFAAWAPGLRRTAYLLCGDWVQAEDLVQTTFAKVFAARRRLHDRAALPAYLRQTLTRTYIDESRRRWRGERPSSDVVHDQHPGDAGHAGNGTSHGPAHSGQPADAGTDDRLVLLAALAQLPTRQRACLVLRFYDDASVADTAAALGCSEGTVKSNTARGLDRLRALIGDLRPEAVPVPRRET